MCNCPNTILTPHIGGSTPDVQSSIGIDVANKIVKYINEGVTIASFFYLNNSTQSRNWIFMFSFL